MQPLTTPDGRYIVVRGRLWRASNPNLSDTERSALVHALSSARRDVKAALRQQDRASLAAARNAVHQAKVALGERGAPWWKDGAKDFNRHMIKNSPYAQWYEEVTAAS
ncbi:hypothetical protein [Pollutimonas thiosulfatoxidans]|uniref:Uncharacterized protein n=1 Tax=Pollutimonas thiosulfatoxidans TaxID=2028345 RepID=A0A410G8C7_9BURK|nr:hypothetical protein [Pollutimonas thiosulfatoxidans]QAA92540.1 hypothetical protein CKA81_00770 [Pollutimonas thiosulfatoxidans]